MTHRTALALDTNGQLVIGVGKGGGPDLSLVTGVEAVLQAVDIRLNTKLGEDRLHPTIGLPIPQMVGVFNRDYIEGSIRSALLQDPDVVRVGAIQLDTVDLSATGVLKVNVALAIRVDDLVIETNLASIVVT